MEEYTEYSIGEEDNLTRLDLYVGNNIGESRVHAKRLIEASGVKINGKVITKSSTRLKTGQQVQINKHAYQLQTPEMIAEDLVTLDTLDIEIVAETDDYVLVNKPAGLLVHKTNMNEVVTLAAWLHNKYPDIATVGEGEYRAGIVHRLDKLASGLLVVAKTQPMYDSLKEQFKGREVEKIYSVLVYGNIEVDHDIIEFPVARGSDGRMVARPVLDPTDLRSVGKKQPGKEAKSEFWVEKHFQHYSLLKVKIHSGRTHQIRVHMYAYNHPVAGDTLYVQKKTERSAKESLPRLFLHAKKLSFTNLDGERIETEIQLPQALQEFLNVIK